MKVSDKSLFAILSRSPWWVSMLIAAAVFVAVSQFFPPIAAASTSVPFLAIGVYAAWRQSSTPAAAVIDDAQSRLRAMSWQEFSGLIESAYRRNGYEVAPFAGGGADYRLSKGGRVTLVGCKRWKIAHTGIGPVRELYEAKIASGADECVYVAVGEFSPNAREFAKSNAIRLPSGADLTKFLK